MTDSEKIEILLRCCRQLVDSVELLSQHDWEVYCKLNIGDYPSQLYAARDEARFVKQVIDNIQKD